MEKQLHSFLPFHSHASALSALHHTVEQSFMEEEFSSELALLQSQQMKPRPEAIAQLLQTITQQTVAEQH